MIKLIRVTDDRKTYIGNDGKEHTSSNVYAEIAINGNVRRIQVKPVFTHDKALFDLAVDGYVHYDKNGKLIEK